MCFFHNAPWAWAAKMNSEFCLLGAVEFPVSFHPAGMNGGFCVPQFRNWTTFWGESLGRISFCSASSLPEGLPKSALLGCCAMGEKQLSDEASAE